MKMNTVLHFSNGGTGTGTDTSMHKNTMCSHNEIFLFLIQLVKKQICDKTNLNVNSFTSTTVFY